jgi:hypothetical protein
MKSSWGSHEAKMSDPLAVCTFMAVTLSRGADNRQESYASILTQQVWGRKARKSFNRIFAVLSGII